MLPPAHVEFTWAVANLVQKLRPRWRLDYRLLALGATLPDLVDKPMAMTLFRRSNAALLIGHTALFHVALWLLAFLTGRQRRWWPYILAAQGHLVLDRIWGFPRTFLWPFRGLAFHRWRNVGSPHRFLTAYLHIITEEPFLILSEVWGALALLWFLADRRLLDRRRLRIFLWTGDPGVGDGRKCEGPERPMM